MKKVIHSKKVVDLLNKLREINLKLTLIYIVFAILLVLTLIYFIRRHNRDRRALRRLINEAFTLWDFTPISTMGYFKTEPDDMPDPEVDEATYSMILKVSKWTHGDYHKELFQHGESECCSLTNNDVMRMEFDGKLNDIHLKVFTNSSCTSDVKNIIDYTVGKLNVYTLDQEGQLFKRNADGNVCWKRMNIENLQKEFKLIAIKVVNDTHKERVFMLYSHSLTDAFNLYELMETPLADQYRIELILESDNINNPSAPVENFSVINLQNGKYLFFFRFSPNIPYFSVFDTASSSKSPKFDFERNFRYVNNNVNVMSQLPIDSSGYIFVLNRYGRVYFKEKPAIIYVPEKSGSTYYLENFLELSKESKLKSLSYHNFSYITADDSYIWGIEKSSRQKLYARKLNDLPNTSWMFMKNKPTKGRLVKIDTAENTRLWFTIVDNGEQQLHPTSKCSPVQIGNTCTIDNLASSMEHVIIRNVPIGEPFHLLVTLTKKRADVYINGKLLKTHIFTGEKPVVSTLKSFRFFGSSYKVEGFLSNFKYFPFHIPFYLIYLLYKMETSARISNYYGCNFGKFNDIQVMNSMRLESLSSKKV